MWVSLLHASQIHVLGIVLLLVFLEKYLLKEFQHVFWSFIRNYSIKGENFTTAYATRWKQVFSSSNFSPFWALLMLLRIFIAFQWKHKAVYHQNQIIKWRLFITIFRVQSYICIMPVLCSCTCPALSQTCRPAYLCQLVGHWTDTSNLIGTQRDLRRRPPASF